jgi:ATP-binding cassette subfamily B protein
VPNQPPKPVSPRGEAGDNAGLRLRSAIKGRERWEVARLAGRPAVGRALEEGLMRHPAVLEARANPVTKGLLVVYSPGAELQVEPLVRELLDRLRDLPAVEAPAHVWSTAATSASPLSRVLRFALPETRALARPVGLTVASQSFNILQGFTFVATVNTARGQAPAFLQLLGIRRTASRLLFMGGLSLLLILLNTWLLWYRRKAWQQLSEDAQRRLREELVARIEAQDLASLRQHGTARLARFVTDDAEAVGELVQMGGDKGVEIAVIVLISGTAVLLASPLIGLILCLPIPIFIASGRLIGRRAGAAAKAAREAANRLAAMLHDSFGGMVDVRSFTAEEREQRRLSKASARVAKASLKAGSLASLEARVNEGAGSLGFHSASVYAGLLAASGRITQERYNLLIALLPKLASVPEKAGDIIELVHDASRAAAGIAEVLDTRPTLRGGPVRLPAVQGEIAFDHVTFSYVPAHPVLEDISFRVQPGETVGIVGPTGSGKSTLLRLLLRFYEVGSGQIRLDGRDVRQYDLGDLRRAVGLVNQEVYLFAGTVRDNVAYGRPDATDEEVIEALREAGALGLLQRLPGGLEAEVGERGSRLSGGERQRVAIARALLKDAPILALDEATSHLDFETEAAVQRSIGQRSEGKSVLMIAHRLAFVRNADRILVLERGRIREQGRHDELVAARGLYASLWDLQSGVAAGAGGLEVRVTWPDEED